MIIHYDEYDSCLVLFLFLCLYHESTKFYEANNVQKNAVSRAYNIHSFCLVEHLPTI